MNERKNRNYNLYNFLLKNTALVLILLLLFNITGILDFSFLFGNFFSILILLSLFFLLFLIYLLKKKKKKESIFNHSRKWSKILFAIGIVLLLMEQIEDKLFTEVLFTNLQNSMTTIVVITSLLGITVFFSDKTATMKIEREKKEGKRKNQTNLIFLILIIALGVFTRFYNLETHSLRDDELYVNSVAHNFINEGDFYMWDWVQNTSGKYTECIETDPYCRYTRAWPYTLLVSASYKVLGMNEFTTRLPGAILGVLSIILIYFVGTYFIGSKKYSLLATLIFTLSPHMITWSRYARMYSLLIPLFLLTTYLIHKGVEEKNNIVFKNKLLKTITKKLDFNYKALIPGLLTLYLCYQVHIVSLILIPLFLTYLIIKLILTKEPRILNLLILFIFLFLIGIFLFNPILQNILNTKILLGSIGDRIRYKEFLLKYPIGIQISLVLTIFLAITSLFKKKKALDSKGLFLGVIVLGSLILYLKFIDTALFIDPRYISFLIPFSYFSITLSIKQILSLYKNKCFSSLIIILIILSSILSFNDFRSYYYSPSFVPDLKKALSTIRENVKQDELVISNSHRRYYIRGVKTEDIVHMPWRKGYPLGNFIQKICEYDSGWVYWEVDKISTHIRPEIFHFAEENFIKIHGSNIDDTNVDVYYFYKEDLEVCF